MKSSQLIAAAVTAAVLGTAGVSIAGATSDGDSAPAAKAAVTPTDSPRSAGAHWARRALRHGLQLAAQTIGIEPRALARELRSGKSIADVAAEHGVDPNTVITALVDAATTKVNAAKTAGKITDQRATKLLANLNRRVTKAVQHKGKIGAHGRRAHRLRRRARAGARVAALTIGLAPKALAQELRAGKSIAQVAAEHGVDPNTVITALVDAATTKVNAAKTAGKITDQQASKLLAGLTERVTKFVNHQFGGDGHGAGPAA
jgi:transposase-like protein